MNHHRTKPAARIRARKYWATPVEHGATFFAYRLRPEYGAIPVYVLRADDLPALVEKGARAVAPMQSTRPWDDIGDNTKAICYDYARAVLRALNLIKKGKDK